MILDFDKIMYALPPANQGWSKLYDLDKVRQAYRKVFATETGKVVLADIAKRGLLHTVSFMGESPLNTAFNEGKRALVLEIIQLLNPNPIRNIKGEPDDDTDEFD